jgi:hypothetical protein
MLHWAVPFGDGLLLLGGEMKSKHTETPASPKVRDAAGRFLPGHGVGVNTRWRNASGNPAGNPHSRRAFEQSFYQALMGEGSPDEAAKLLWSCARNKEPWAIQNLLGRIAPQEARLKITPEANTNGTYDLSRLSDTELDLFISLAARAAEGANNAATRLIEGGEGPAPLP